MTRVKRPALYYSLLFMMTGISLATLVLDLMAPLPYDLVVKSELGRVPYHDTLPFYIKNNNTGTRIKPLTHKIALSMKIQHHLFTPTKYRVYSNCVLDLKINEQYVYAISNINECRKRQRLVLDFSPYLQEGENTISGDIFIKAQLPENIHNTTHLYVKPCYRFGFC